MSADCFVPNHPNPMASLRAWSRYALVTLPGILFAAGAAAVPSEPSSENTTPGREETPKSRERPPIWWQAALYGTLLAAMLTNRYLRGHNNGVSGTVFTTTYLLQDAIAALTAFPMVYAKLQQKSDQPLFAQLGVIFTAGMGWQHLIYSVYPTSS